MATTATPVLRKYMMNFGVSGTGLTNSINFKLPSDAAALVAVRLTVAHYLKAFNQPIERVELYHMVEVRDLCPYWSSISLEEEPATLSEQLAEERAIADLDSEEPTHG